MSIQVGPDIEALSSVLVKPLRPLWIGCATRVLPPEQQPRLEELAFTPLFLVSASQPDTRQRLVVGAKACAY